MKKNRAAQALARRRWDSPDADRDQPRRAGLLGGRPRSCDCGACAVCKRRAARQVKSLIEDFGYTRAEAIELVKAGFGEELACK
jgi:hypothetical protein